MEGDGFGDRHMFMRDLCVLSVEGSRDHGALETVKTKQAALEVEPFFWDVTLRPSVCNSRRFEGFYCLHLQGLGQNTGLFEMIVGVMLPTVWNELDYRVDVCRVTNSARIEHL